MEHPVRYLRTSGLVVAALGSLAVLATVPVAVEFATSPRVDTGVGILVGVVSGTGVIYGAYRVRSRFPSAVIGTVSDLTLAGTLLLGLLVSPILFADTPDRPFELLRTMASIGMLTGFLVGYSRGQTELIRQQAGELASERERFEFLNSLLRHDVSNKLLVLIGNAELRLEQGPASEPDRAALEGVLEAARDIQHMMDDMEALTQPRSAEEVAAVELDSLLEPGLETVRLDDDATLETDIEPDLTVAANDPLASAFRNLCQNAVQHNDAPTVTVTARRVDDEVEIRIADDGRGIPEDRRDALFGSDSPGFGLFIVKELVARYDGRIEISDNHPTGTVFTIGLPAEPDAARAGVLTGCAMVTVVD